jgi:diaminopimelate epimerase
MAKSRWTWACRDSIRRSFRFRRNAARPSIAIDVGGKTVEISALSMGNPHAVQVVDDVERAPVTSEGAAL